MIPWRYVLGLCLVAGAMGCRRRARAIVQPAMSAPVAAAVSAPPAVPVDDADPQRLLPGTESAFGLRLPLRTSPRLQNTSMKMFLVEAPMPRVMQYLQERLRIQTANIHPLAAMIRNAQVLEAGVGIVVDVGVRDEGDRTLVTVWNRSTPPETAVGTRSLDEGLRGAGIDPRTGRPLPEYNN